MASPGLTSVDTICDRVALLIATYIDTEVDLIDTRNNTIAGASADNSFTTPSVPAAAVQVYVDDLPGQSIRIIVTDEGSQTVGEFTYYGQGMGAAPPSAHPTIDRQHRIGVAILAANTGGAQTTAGSTSTFHARRVCNRIADAVRIIMARYPQLDIPSLSKTAICAGVTLANDARAAQVTEDDHQLYAREITYDVRTIEDRST